MKARHITATGKPSRAWIDYTKWALAFDWVNEYPGFEQKHEDRIANELLDGGAAMLATADFADAGQLSYHNYATRYLALAAFTSAAVDRYPGCGARCDTWRTQVSRDSRTFLKPRTSWTPKAVTTNRWTTCESRGQH